MGEIGGRGMGILFEHAEKMDIQAERRNTAREKSVRMRHKSCRKGISGLMLASTVIGPMSTFWQI